VGSFCPSAVLSDPPCLITLHAFRILPQGREAAFLPNVRVTRFCFSASLSASSKSLALKEVGWLLRFTSAHGLLEMSGMIKPAAVVMLFQFTAGLVYTVRTN
jgi:hypothetical protein